MKRRETNGINSKIALVYLLESYQATTQGATTQAELNSLTELKRWIWESEQDEIKHVGRMISKKEREDLSYQYWE